MSSQPSVEDVAANVWPGITTRVAWTLLGAGVRVRGDVLSAARDHVLFHLEPGMDSPRAEDLAGLLTVDFVSRARRRPVVDPWPADRALPLSARWLRTFERELDPFVFRLFRARFGDGKPLSFLAPRLGFEQSQLEVGLNTCRDLLRKVAEDDGVPLHAWTEERLDRILGRLAAFSPGPCPETSEIIAGLHPEHRDMCPRCDRTFRLVRGGVLRPDDLVPPSEGAMPRGTVQALALHVQPLARKWLPELVRFAEGPATVLSDDIVIIDHSDEYASRQLLRTAAECGTPRRDDVRGCALHGPGRWTSQGLVGPLATEAILAVRAVPWGTVEPFGELPAALPEPPSSRAWWVAVAALAAATLLIVVSAISTGANAAHTGLDVSFTEGRGGIWAQFDTVEDAYVLAVRESNGVLDVVIHTPTPAEKVSLATGDGSYRLHAVGEATLVATAREELPDIQPLLDAARHSPTPLEDFAARLKSRVPKADVAYVRP